MDNYQVENLVATTYQMITSKIPPQINSDSYIQNLSYRSSDGQSQNNTFSCASCRQPKAQTRICLCTAHVHDYCAQTYFRQRLKCQQQLSRFYFQRDHDDVAYIECSKCKHKIRFTAETVYTKKNCDQIKQYVCQNKLDSVLAALAPIFLIFTFILTILLILNMAGVMHWVEPSNETIYLFVLVLIFLVLIWVGLLYLTLRETLYIGGVRQTKLYVYGIKERQKLHEQNLPQPQV